MIFFTLLSAPFFLSPQTRRGRHRIARRSEVAQVDALVGAVISGMPQQRLAALGEETVGDALRESRAEVARVGEAGHHRHDAAPGSCSEIQRDRLHQRRSVGEGLPSTCSVNSIRKPSRSPSTSAIARHRRLAQARRHPAIDRTRAARDHVDLLRGADPRRAKVTPSIGSNRLQAWVGGDRATAPAGSAGSSPSPARTRRPAVST